ncbi:MAG: flavin reductase family protein [Peptococcaceae bacterium]|jgi:flavin reductase (DIM6/NTAB) family NADH-FMN oxidoreductase RutF|nr:flavin reductase family protein [Peptococcaceae bacterium]
MMKENLGARTVLFPTPVLVVATYDGAGRPNGMTAAWGGICCSDPPCVTVSLRKATYTYNSLMERKAYTVNIGGKKYAKEADYFGIASARDEDKFAVTGLTPVKSDFVDAPYIEEFPVNLECKIVHIADLGLHTMFVGEVVNAKVDSAIAGNTAQPMIEQVMPMIFAPNSRNYYTIGEDLGQAFSLGKSLMK